MEYKLYIMETHYLDITIVRGMLILRLEFSLSCTTPPSGRVATVTLGFFIPTGKNYEVKNS